MGGGRCRWGLSWALLVLLVLLPSLAWSAPPSAKKKAPRPAVHDPSERAPAAAPAPPAEPTPGEEPAPPAEPPAGEEPTPSEADARVRYILEGIDVRGNRRTADRVVLRYVPFEAGDVIDVADDELTLTRYRLLGTGFFSKVGLSLRKGSQRGSAVLVITVVERNTLVIERIVMGIAADEDTDGNSEPLSPYLGLQVAETNLAGTGITLGAGVGVAADQFSLHSRFADPAFAGSEWMVSAELHYIGARDFFGNRQVSFESPLLDQREVTDYAVVDYTRFGGTLGAGIDLDVATQVSFEYLLEGVDAVVPTTASHVRGHTREPIVFDMLPGKSVLSGLRAAMTYDSRDTPFLPTRGTLADVRVSSALALLGSSYGYAKFEAGWSRWWQLPFKHVVSGRVRLGAVIGEPPFFEKFYVGDFTDLLPDRVLGLNPDRRQPPNYLNTDIVEVRYGDYAARIEGEYRIPLYRGRDAIYGIDLFGAAGLYAVASQRDFVAPPSGYAGAQLVPLDLSYNLGLRFETYVGGFSVAFSNLLGLLPAGSGGRK